MHFFGRSKSHVGLDVGDGPVTVVTAKFGGNASFVPQAPGIPRILNDRGKPYGVGSQFFEKARSKHFGNSGDIASVIIGLGIDIRIRHYAVVRLASVLESIDHHEVHDGSVPIGPRELVR